MNKKDIKELLNYLDMSLFQTLLLLSLFIAMEAYEYFKGVNL